MYYEHNSSKYSEQDERPYKTKGATAVTLTFCRIFHAIVQQGNFIKAAEVMHMTPSAVSHAVSDAERQVGFKLFSRTRGGVVMTEYGKELYGAILQLLNGEEALQQTIDQLNGLERGTVRLGIFNSVCTNWMPDILDRFGARYPGIKIDLYEGGYDDVIAWIKNGAVDLGFLSTSCAPDLPVEPFYRDPLICIVPPDFETARPGYITIDEMRDQSFVIQREGSDADVQLLFRKYGLRFHASCHLLDDTSIMTMVACRRGISVMAALTAKGLEGDLKVLRILPQECRHIGLAALDKKRLSPAARELYDTIAAYVRDLEERRVREEGEAGVLLA